MKEKQTLTLPKIEDEKPKLPTIADLVEGIDGIEKTEGLNAILATPPPEKWVKEHPYIKGHRYLPIDKVEYLLKKLFKRVSIQITGQGTAFNGVWVTVRVNYMDPATGEMVYQDGIGGAQLQTAKGTSPADLSNINQGAISMAFPIAKTYAVKDACGLIGNIFGANLDRKDTIQYSADTDLIDRVEKRKQLLEKNGIDV